MKRTYDFLINNLPLALRISEVIRSFLRSVSVALDSVKAKMNTYFEELNFYVRITPQVYLLERLLNKKINETNQKIYITNSIEIPALYFSEAGSSNMCFFDNGGFFAYIDPFGADIDFLVLVPSYYENNENAINRIRFYLDMYKLFSTTYTIIFYE